MAVPIRLWDSNIVFYYLSGEPSVKSVCDLILKQAEHGEIELRVSVIAQAEVAYLPGYSDVDSENIVLEFFSRNYITTVNYDILVSREARRLIRKYKPGFKPQDAIHMATAVLWHIPVLETIDTDLLKLSGKEGSPPLIIRKPKYEGAEAPSFLSLIDEPPETL
jgi:predicted nucleic acid-binding protein